MIKLDDFRTNGKKKVIFVKYQMNNFREFDW